MPSKSEVPSKQRDDSEEDSPLILPKGSPIVLYKVNPASDLTPQTTGQTTSDNQLKPGTDGGVPPVRSPGF